MPKKRFEWPDFEDLVLGVLAAFILNLVILAIIWSWMAMFDDLSAKKPTAGCVMTDAAQCVERCPPGDK